MVFKRGHNVPPLAAGAQKTPGLDRVKHGLLEGPTFFFQHKYTSRRLLESSRLGELRYAISAGYYVRLENKSLRKCKN